MSNQNHNLSETDKPVPFADYAINTKDGRLVQFCPNRQQMGLLRAIGVQQSADVPVRLLILKFRRPGISTAVEAVMFREVSEKSNRTALVSAHDDVSSENIFQMARRFQDNLPVARRRPTDYSSRREIAWSAPHSSRFIVQTAGNINLGRSFTLQYLHCSEVAFWSNAKRSLLSVLQSVADVPDTMIFLESTANGVGGEFYDRWQAAVQKLRERPGDPSGYLPIFFSWLDFPEYSEPLPSDYRLGELDEAELGLQGRGATDEQLFWRRKVVAEKCGGDADLFLQEYPSTASEAFISSGRSAIASSILREHRRTVERPRRGRFVYDTLVDCGVRLEWDLNKGASPVWNIWRTPQEFHDYTVGGDVAEGALSDPSDIKSEGDYSAATVLDRVTLAQAAQIRVRMDPDLFGLEMLKAAIYYDRGWSSPEANAAGMAALMVFKRKNYSRTYRRRMDDDRLELKEAGRLGWKTTVANRDQMIDDWLAACRPDPVNGFDGQIVNLSADLVAEEETFVNNNGKREHRAGCFDDVLFSEMIAYQLHLRCPRTRIISFPHRTNMRSLGLQYVDGTDTELAELEGIYSRNERVG